ncbi:MAG: C25 family cysteine peptidase, partial [candidate division WOR-3 bacterium]
GPDYGPRAFPEQLASGGPVGIEGGLRMCDELLVPGRYDQTDQRLVLYTRFQVEVNYEPGASVEVLTERQLATSWAGVAAQVANPLDVPEFAPPVRPSDDYVVDYLVITGEQFVANLQPLADWKTSKGYRTEIKTVTSIVNRYPGRDVPEQIRNCVKDYYANRGLRYLLLAGDVSVVPCRRARAIVGGEVGNIPCDLYFADLQGSWDGNRNNIFGEAQVDSVDMYADIFVGRLPAENAPAFGLALAISELPRSDCEQCHCRAGAAGLAPGAA